MTQPCCGLLMYPWVSFTALLSNTVLSSTMRPPEYLPCGLLWRLNKLIPLRSSGPGKQHSVNTAKLNEVQTQEKVLEHMLLTLSYSSIPLFPSPQMPHFWVVDIVETPRRRKNLRFGLELQIQRKKKWNSWFIQHFLSTLVYSPILHLARLELPQGLSLLLLISFSLILVPFFTKRM